MKKAFKSIYTLIITLLIALLFVLSIILLNDVHILSLKGRDIFALGETILLTGMAFTFISDRNIKINWIRDKSIIRSFILAFWGEIIIGICLYWYMVLPLLFKKNTIPIGSNQYVSNYPPLSIESFLVTSSISVVFEEIVFRVVVFSVLAWIFRGLFKLLKKENAKVDITNLKSKEGIIILIVASLIFGLAHGFNLMSLPLYFVPGLFFGYLYCKRGLAFSIIAHTTGNYLTHAIQAIAFSILRFM